MRILTALALLVVSACNGGGSTSPAAPPNPSPGTTAIFAVQGAGATSPLDGQSVTVEGVVTGDFQDNDSDNSRNLGGFYIQGSPDGNSATSDGVFAFVGNNPVVDVTVGDLVRVTGNVAEFFGETQINASSVDVIGSGSITPTPVNLPVSTTTNSDGERIADLERFEGMLVSFPQTLTVSQLRYLERFGEIMLSQGGRPFTYTQTNLPDAGGFDAHLNDIAARRILLDDGRRNNNPGGQLPDVRNGDEVSNLVGVLRYSRGSGPDGDETWRLMPTETVAFDSVNPRPAAPAVGGSLRVVAFNVNNYFSTIDNGANNCGPFGGEECRGADSSSELNRQLAKIVTALSMMDADVVGLVELENNASDSLQTIVDALNANLGAGSYDFVDSGTIGTDVIKVGFIFKPATVQRAGDFAILDSSVDNRFNDDRNRPVLAQSFEANSNSARLTLALNHLKSKGSDCEDEGDPDRGDGQGNCSGIRRAAAEAMIDWLATDPTSSGDSDVLVMGDLNAYAKGDAIAVFKDAGYTNIAASLLGADAYSFEFDGQIGALDHALASPSLAAQVADAAEWHINADEAPWNDYNLEFGRNPAIFDASTPYRTSDHDPIIVGLDLSP